MTGAELARLLILVADQLDGHGLSGAGPVRQAARYIAEAPAVEEPSCPVCGGQVPAGGRGRPARFCSDRCRLYAWRETKRNEDRRLGA